MHSLKLMLGVMLLVVGAVATPVGAQAAAEGFLALQGVQAEALSDQELDAIKGQEVPTFAVLIPSTTCTTNCDTIPISGVLSMGPAVDGVGGVNVTRDGTTVHNSICYCGVTFHLSL